MIQGFLLEPAARMPATTADEEVLLFYLSEDLNLPYPGGAAPQVSTRNSENYVQSGRKLKLLGNSLVGHPSV